MLIEGANRNAFLEKKDLVDGEFIKIVDGGWKEESKKYTNKDGSPKVRWMFNVQRMGVTCTTEFNWTSIKEICSVYGAETSDWAGKFVKISKVFDPAKKMTMIYYLPVDKSKNDELGKTDKPKVTGAVTDPSEIAWEEN